MFKCTLALTAETILRDADTQRISVINIFEVITSAAFPMALPRFSCLFYLAREEGDPTAVDGFMRISSNGRTVHDLPFHFDFGDQRAGRFVGHVQNLPVGEPGVLHIAVLDNNMKDIGGWEIQVRQIEPPKLVKDG